ncbi:MAG: DUF2092 domain-containing protein [Planctomycetes bacterium]|nr:DUF2092 domain-containing protein [Planctomycetota bacterium]
MIAVLAVSVFSSPRALRGAGEQDSQPAGSDPGRRQVHQRLEAVVKVLSKAEAIAFDLNVGQSGGEDARPFAGKKARYALKRPNLVREERSDSLAVADGKVIWSYRRDQNSYTPIHHSEYMFAVTLVDVKLVAQLFFGGDVTLMLDKQRDLSLQKDKIGDIECDVLCWKGSNRQGMTTAHRIWIDGQCLPRRIERRTERNVLDGPAHVTLATYEISELAFNPSLAAGTFVFTPPKDARERTLIEINSRGEMPESPEARKAQEILEAVQGTLKAIEAIEYALESHMEGEGINPKKSASRRRIQAQRPGLARFDDVSPRGERIYLLDGEWMWTIAPAGKTYRRSGQMDPYLSARGVNPEPYFRLFFEKNPTRLLAGCRDVKVSRSKWGEKECDVIEWTETKDHGSERRLSFWVDDARRPVQYTREWNYQDKTYVERVRYGPANLAAKPDSEVFKFAPPAGWTDEAEIGLDHGLIAVGSPAPDFEATDLDGKKVGFSDFRGKPLLLMFWFYG